MTSEAWFETWFDSPLYEQIYAERDNEEAARLVDWITEHFPPLEYPRVLDMGCGRGRHSLYLADKGYRVTGVDLSPKAIIKAREKACDQGFTNIIFQTGDMRTYTNGPFELVCNLFTSFGYFDDDRENEMVLENMVANLGPHGVLVMDYLNPGFIRANLVPEEQRKVGSFACNIERFVEGDMIVKSILFTGRGEDGDKRYQERVKLYESNWFRDKFRKMGLTNHRFYGNYEGGTYDENGSPRQLMVATRR